MVQGNISQEFRLKNIDETKNWLIEEINRNELMSKKHKKVCTTISNIEHFFIWASANIGCVSISIASLLGTPIEITSLAIGLKASAITVGIKKYKSIVQNKRKIML